MVQLLNVGAEPTVLLMAPPFVFVLLPVKMTLLIKGEALPLNIPAPAGPEYESI